MLPLFDDSMVNPPFYKKIVLEELFTGYIKKAVMNKSLMTAEDRPRHSIVIGVF
jgi:hypothetical protein